ncbi:beta-lactamase [hydrocarbon metagenome]|uniref:Beta-lactamase n=1 Tax=hydrocarbon metagenome TaxID=938273 RepID=A0A0W8G108_9ZZZZ
MKLLYKLITLFLLSINLFSQVDYEKLDQYIAEAVKDFEAAGLAVAIVKDSQVVFSKAYGYADIEKQTPLTTKSLFNIASCTKAFISAIVAKQVDEGNLKWSDKVVDHIPNFKLSDIWITNQLNMVDILSHRSGLKTFAGDLLWFQTGYSNEEIIKRMQYLPIEREFRSEYGYQNNMYMIAGEIVSKSSGIQWYEYLDKEIFDKLDMSSSKASSSHLNEKDDVAYPHIESKRYPLTSEKPHAAGSIFSNVDEMSKWVTMLLNNGSYNGNQVLSESVINDMFTPRTILWLGNSMRKAGANFHTYGLGWFMYDYHGQKIIYHDGGMPGYIARVMLLPKENLGLVILTNELNPLPQAISLQIVDMFLGNDDVDWVADYLERVNTYKERDAVRENEKAENRITGTTHSLELAGYTGKYNDNSYGEAEVKLVDDVLVIKFPTKGFETEMEHWHYDTFKVELDDFLPSGYVTFDFNSKGEVTGFKIDLPNPDFHFNDLYFEKVE